MSDEIRLTQFSHGAGCGCKISPSVLAQILSVAGPVIPDPRIIVGNQNSDDAAVLDLDDGSAIVSTTDFFMPIVDDAFTFGRIAATNALSDIYAMGAQPLMAIAILGWPISKLPASLAGRVVAGGRQACLDAGIALAGGHSIDSPEPIFGLAVTGRVQKVHLKQNSTARKGDLLCLTKPLGVGILTTALKHGKLQPEHLKTAPELMCTLNSLGPKFGVLSGVSAMTDVTGFGLLGHLREMCDASGLSARLDYSKIPKLDCVNAYIDAGCIPGGSARNFESYGHAVEGLLSTQRPLLCDPQTSGGLLISVNPKSVSEVRSIALKDGIELEPFGQMVARHPNDISVMVET